MNRSRPYEILQIPENRPTDHGISAAVSPQSVRTEHELTNNLDVETMQFITENMIKRRAQYFGPGHWGVLLALAITGESTFAQVNAWLEDDSGAEISGSTLRESIKALEALGMIVQAGDEASARGPKSARYAITELGLQQVERAPRAPIAHAG